MFKALLKNGTIETKSFRNISDLGDIICLESADLVQIGIDMPTGYIYLDGVMQMRLLPYFGANAKPIQYRKVIEELGIIDYELIYEEVKEKMPDKVWLFEAVMCNPTEQNFKALNDFCTEYVGTIPTRKLEEQVIGYEYTKENTKIKIEVKADLEVKSIVAVITTTDLTTKQKSERYIRLR